MEYAAILLLLKKRRKPKYSIDVGLKKMFNNGDATQPLQGGRRAGSGGPGTPTSAGAMEEAKRMVSHFLITYSDTISLIRFLQGVSFGKLYKVERIILFFA